MNKHNIKSPRELEYAQILLATYNEIKDGAALLGLTSRKDLKLPLLEEADKRGVWFSILGDRDVLETLESLAELTYKIKQYEGRKKKVRKADEKKAWEEMLKKTKERLGKSLMRLETMSRLWDEYQEIEG